MLADGMSVEICNMFHLHTNVRISLIGEDSTVTIFNPFNGCFFQVERLGISGNGLFTGLSCYQTISNITWTGTQSINPSPHAFFLDKKNG